MMEIMDDYLLAKSVRERLESDEKAIEVNIDEL